MWVEPETAGGEFVRVRLGDDNGAGRTEPAHHQGIGGGRGGIGEDLRPCASRFASNIEPVLEGDDCAVERPERHP